MPLGALHYEWSLSRAVLRSQLVRRRLPTLPKQSCRQVNQKLDALDIDWPLAILTLLSPAEPKEQLRSLALSHHHIHHTHFQLYEICQTTRLFAPRSPSSFLPMRFEIASAVISPITPTLRLVRPTEPQSLQLCFST
jgi:hypothetical protein